MKKLFCLAIALVMCLALCAGAAAEEGNWKIAIMTGTTNQGEEEFRAAERAVQTYGAEHIVTDTYPDNFSADTQTTVARLLAFAEDPDIKAIVICQAVPGTTEAFEQIREAREDILLIAGAPQESPAVVSTAADILLYANEPGEADGIAATCQKWGIDVFVHYSFPRHLNMETIAARRTLLQEKFAEMGIEFVDVEAPDPTAEGGTAASDAFILADVPARMQAYAGKKVAFFATNCSMQEPLQKAVLAQENAYYPQPCCPSPYHGFIGSLGLDISAGSDDEGALRAVAAKLNEAGAIGRFSTWDSPINMKIIEMGVDYAKAYIDGEVGKCDPNRIHELWAADAPEADVQNYENAAGTYENFFVVMLSPIDFGDYL